MALDTAPELLPVVVVAHEDPGTADSLRHAVEAGAGWRVVVAEPGPDALGAAISGGPAAALIGCERLADLPAPCPVPVLAIGDDARPADLRAALTVGAKGLLAWPDGAADLASELARVTTIPRLRLAEDTGTLLVAIRGVQGGAGTTTVAAHLAAAWARWGPRPVLLADLCGGLGFRLDLVPGTRTWSSIKAMKAPLNGESLSRALAEPLPGLSVLPLTGLADGGLPEPAPEPWTIQSILEAARTAYRVLVVDLPIRDTPAVDAVLAQADVLLVVGRSESAGVRALRVAIDTWNGLDRGYQAVGAVVTRARSDASIATREIRSALGEALWALIPAAEIELRAAAEDGMLLLHRPELPAVHAMIALANRVVPFPAGAAR